MAIYSGQPVTGWRDNFAALTAAATGAGTPSLQPFGPTGNIKQRRFGVGDSVYVILHWNHDLKPGSICYPHVHWSTDGTDTSAVTWQVSYTSAAGHNRGNFGADTVLTLSEAAAGTAWRHMVTEDTTGLVVPEVDSLTVMEVKRINNTTSPVADNADQVFGLFVDIHYQVGPFYGTRLRSPGFY